MVNEVAQARNVDKLRFEIRLMQPEQQNKRIFSLMEQKDDMPRKLVGQVGHIIIVMIPLEELAISHGVAKSYLHRQILSGELIGMKYKNCWYGEENLSLITREGFGS